jgi:hypothetical protein
VLNRGVAIAAVVIITCCLAAIPALLSGGYVEEIRDPKPVPNDLISRVRTLSGPNARSCGIVEHKRGSPRPQMDCVAAAFGSRAAFWSVSHGPSIDSIIWSGLARDDQGKLWTVKLDTDVTGGHGASK